MESCAKLGGLHLSHCVMVCLTTCGISLAIARQANAQQYVTLTGSQVLNVANGDSYYVVEAYDTSQVNILSSSTQTSPVFNPSIGEAFLYDHAAMTVAGGSAALIDSEDTSTVSVQAGNIGDVIADDQSTVSISGGNINLLEVDNANNAQVSGGSIAMLYSLGSNTNVIGGSFGIQATVLSGDISLYGTNFALLSSTAGAITNSRYTYNGAFFTVSGKLEDNSASATYTLFDATSRITNSTGVSTLAPGDFILHDLLNGSTTILDASAPEPATFSLAFFGVLGLKVSKRLTIRRKRTAIFRF